MGNPSNFVSFADYLGLNTGVGQQMLDRTVDEREKEFTDAHEKNSEEQRTIARTGGTDEQFKAAGDKLRSGLASYGDFLKGMNDPEERQTLMEKVYGKGGVSWLDSSLAGGGGGNRLAQERTEADQRQSLMEGNEGRHRERLVGDRKARQDSWNLEYKRVTEKNTREEQERLGRQFAELEFDDVDKTHPSYVQLTPRQREEQIQLRAKHFNAIGAYGKIDWAKYRDGTKKMQAQWDAGSANDVGNWGVVKDAHKWFMGIAGQKVPEKHKPQTWESYVGQHAAHGAK